jgi:hypothetical protein
VAPTDAALQWPADGSSRAAGRRWRVGGLRRDRACPASFDRHPPESLPGSLDELLGAREAPVLQSCFTRAGPNRWRPAPVIICCPQGRRCSTAGFSLLGSFEPRRLSSTNSPPSEGRCTATSEWPGGVARTWGRPLPSSPGRGHPTREPGEWPGWWSSSMCGCAMAVACPAAARGSWRTEHVPMSPMTCPDGPWTGRRTADRVSGERLGR